MQQPHQSGGLLALALSQHLCTIFSHHNGVLKLCCQAAIWRDARPACLVQRPGLLLPRPQRQDWLNRERLPQLHAASPDIPVM